MKKNRRNKKDRDMDKPATRKGGPSCDPDLLSWAITLDNGAVVEERPNDYATLVKTMMICDSSHCSSRTLF